MQIAAGFNINFLDHKLPIPPEVSLIEGGMAQLSLFLNNSLFKNLDYSLHLSRPAMTEDETTQCEYVSYLKKNCLSSKRIKTIGMHLNGPRTSVLGKYGFSSHFTPNEENKKKVIKFLEIYHKEISIPLLLENANFYSASIDEIFDVWKFINTIVENFPIYLIVDLAHIFVNAKNLKIDPKIVLGSIPWKNVKGIHISGVVKDLNNVFHDGHNFSPIDEIWDLFDESLKFINDSNESFITLEHTDYCWKDNKVLYYSDFKKLIHYVEINKKFKINMINKSLNYQDQERFAQSYLKKIIKQRVPLLEKYLMQNKMSYDDVFKKWCQKVFLSDQKRLVFSKSEVSEKEYSEVEVIVKGFLKFLKDFRVNDENWC